MIQAHAIPRPKEDYRLGPTVSQPTDHNPTTWLHPYQSHQGPVHSCLVPNRAPGLQQKGGYQTQKPTESFSTKILTLFDSPILQRDTLKTSRSKKQKKCFISCIHQTYIQLAWSMSVSERSWSWEMNSRIRSRLIFALGSVSLKTLKEKCAKNVQNLKFVKLLDCWLTCGHTFKIALSFTNVSSYVTERMFFNCVPPLNPRQVFRDFLVCFNHFVAVVYYSM